VTPKRLIEYSALIGPIVIVYFWFSSHFITSDAHAWRQVSIGIVAGLICVFYAIAIFIVYLPQNNHKNPGAKFAIFFYILCAAFAFYNSFIIWVFIGY
jgi:glucan phosphoethanolaminetransferase (alkaline phosphatase superfamily)